jgi:hypothetical protein
MNSDIFGFGKGSDNVLFDCLKKGGFSRAVPLTDEEIRQIYPKSEEINTDLLKPSSPQQSACSIE